MAVTVPQAEREMALPERQLLRPGGTVIVGIEWGDEGKGKQVDIVSAEADAVVRFQGGNNAGHMVVKNGETLAFHLIPSGISHERPISILGNGVVVDPKALLGEIDELRARGLCIDSENLKISEAATVIAPYHLAQDSSSEQAAGSNGQVKIGTTQRGIGPSYRDKVARLGIRVGDLLDRRVLEIKLKGGLANDAHQRPVPAKRFEQDQLLEELAYYGEILAPHIEDTGARLAAMHRDGGKIVYESAQGTLLDIDHGTYPFVTSSNPVASAAATGSGVGPGNLNEVWGIVKAYKTRVGEGPFPTELYDGDKLDDPAGQHMAVVGREFGSTTGRGRRCGWQDLPSLHYAARVNGLTHLSVAKLDVLTGLDPIRLCVGYQLPNGEVTTDFSATAFGNAHLVNEARQWRPYYRDFRGWDQDISEIQDYRDLPAAAREYLAFIQEALRLPINCVGVGPDSRQMIFV